MSPTPFGRLPNGENVEAYDLTLPDGSGCRIITLGAIVTELRVPDKQGDLADVVLGFDRLAPYLGPHPYFGAIAGRVAPMVRPLCGSNITAPTARRGIPATSMLP